MLVNYNPEKWLISDYNTNNWIFKVWLFIPLYALNLPLVQCQTYLACKYPNKYSNVEIDAERYQRFLELKKKILISTTS